MGKTLPTAAWPWGKGKITTTDSVAVSSKSTTPLNDDNRSSGDHKGTSFRTSAMYAGIAIGACLALVMLAYVGFAQVGTLRYCFSTEANTESQSDNNSPTPPMLNVGRRKKPVLFHGSRAKRHHVVTGCLQHYYTNHDQISVGCHSLAFMGGFKGHEVGLVLNSDTVEVRYCKPGLL